MENKKSPLLSICIPTYNREKYLKECLDSIIYQDGFNEEEIEIVISDNASKDGTKELVEEYQKKYTNIRYFRNDENIGANRNIMNLSLSLAQGEYVWLFGDDDIMSPVGIKKTIYAVKNCKVDLLLSYRVDFSSGNQSNIVLIDNESKPEIYNGIYSFSTFLSTNINTYFWRYAELFTFISIMCFKRSLFQSNFNKINSKYSERYMKYLSDKHYFSHSIILYGMIDKDVRVGVYKDTLTYTRVGTQGWNMGFKTVKDISNIFSVFYKNHSSINRRILVTFFRIVISWIFPAVVGTFKPYIPKRIFEFARTIYLKVF